MEETPTSDNIINFNNLSSNDEENSKIQDEIVIDKFMNTCVAVISLILLFIFFHIFFPLFLFEIPYKKILIFDKINNVLIFTYTGMLGCRISKCSKYYRNKTYNLSQIKKVKIYRTSEADPNIVFNKLYYINCCVYSTDGQTDDLFPGIPFNQEKYDEIVTFFKKHFNTEIIPFETDINTYDVNNDSNDNNDLYP